MKHGVFSRSKLIIVIPFLFALASLFALPAVDHFIERAWHVLRSANVEQVRLFLLSYGSFSALVSFLLLILQAVIAPLPGSLITFANGLVFGWWQGFLLSWSAVMIGATICFYLSRKLARKFAERWANPQLIAALDQYIQKYGAWTILTARLVPFVSFDLISYAAGMTKVKFWTYLWTTAIGQIPVTLLYSYLGEKAAGTIKFLLFFLSASFLLTLFSFWLKRKRKQMRASQPS
ncbi:MAG: hypothetical protein A2189_06180 [Paenibacillus sp. RIFOXYA1_FULL_44_5]|nr:MAG: hypothetical protein A2189_06180 [Paenibacillus sp. RIFOXYA1_FULL_44_5]